MLLNLSQIKSFLFNAGNTSLHRKVFILFGQFEWQKNFLKDLLIGYEDSSLWVGEEKTDDYLFIDVKKAASWLGKEKKVVIFDANKDFNPDSFAAISGIVVGGGLFFLLLPEKEKWNEVYDSPFGRRLIQSIYHQSTLVLLNQNDEDFSFSFEHDKPNIIQDFDAPFLTLDQQHAVETIQKHCAKENDTPIVLVSDRGRGKSAALGIAAARLLDSGIKNIVITAPRLSATDIIFKHIAENLSGAEVTRGCVKLNELTIQFYAPDYLLQENIEADILLIDEAAAIPVPLLTSFLYKYPQCVFATTIHGYEGTGRGFSLRFYKELDKKNKNWLKLKMHTPIRWAENDPLEKWMFDLLCLDAEIVGKAELVNADIHTLENSLLNKEQLKNNLLLNEVFSLLVLAHYRTRPKDLKSLLDDDNISVYVSLYNNHVIAVALVIHEGFFSNELSTEVYQGIRRPQGHLLAQTLTYHCGIENAATLDYARIMRIAVHPELQHKGIGTELIDFIVSSEKEQGRDAIGTSFGLNLTLLNFWKKSKFEVVRLGFTREQTSGEHAAIMLQAFSEKGEIVKQTAKIQFNDKLELWFDGVLEDMPLVLKNEFQLNGEKELKLSSFDKKDLDSFVHYSRSYELCISAINKFVVMRLEEINNETLPNDFKHILNMKLIEKLSWKKIGDSLNLTGKTEARKLFRSAVSFLFSDK